MKKLDSETLDFIASTGTEYVLESEDYCFPDSPPTIYELRLARQADIVLEKLCPFDGLKELVIDERADVTKAGLKFLAGAKDLTAIMFSEIEGQRLPPEAFACLADIPSLESLDFFFIDGKQLPPEAFAHLADIPKLASLTVDYHGNTAAALRHISAIKHLRSLILMGDFGDDGLEYLPRLQSLKELGLADDTTVTNEGLKHVSKLTNLESLELSSGIIGDKGLQEIGKLHHLRTLYISCPQITDKGIASLHELKYLKTLYAKKTRITDKSVPWISAHRELEDLNLSGTKVTDAGVAYLMNHPRLVQINLNETRVTEKVARALFEKLLARHGTDACVSWGDRTFFQEEDGTVRDLDVDGLFQRSQDKIDKEMADYFAMLDRMVEEFKKKEEKGQDK